MNTNIRSEISEVVQELDTISLEEMDTVSLMRRMDVKYVFSVQKLPEILKSIASDYLVCEINEQREQSYETTYFDTPSLDMYKQHHKGKLNRHKIRVRKYLSTGEQYIEVKRKNNRRETVKKRVRISSHSADVNSSQAEKILSHTPYLMSDLQPSLSNKFIRITLVNKNLTERVTIDYSLGFNDERNNKELHTSKLCVLEVKKNRGDSNRGFSNVLFQNKIAPMGYSKYCIGLALLNKDLKTNLFNMRLRALNKIN